jgi:hypothetical protein
VRSRLVRQSPIQNFQGLMILGCKSYLQVFYITISGVLVVKKNIWFRGITMLGNLT